MPNADERRATILAAARTVFLRDGYPGAKLTDVADEAGCSVGTLYTYFKDRDDLLAAVLRGAEEEMRHARRSVGGGGVGGDGDKGVGAAAQISAANRAYLESYRRNARVMALLEQVSQVHPGFRELRVRRAREFVARNARALEALREAGEIDAGVDVPVMAAALSAMVSRLAYAAWVDGEYADDDASLERIAATVDRIWWASLGMGAGTESA
ncbi:TetR/AcrR family transcriptional regulator [Corynebacterium sp. NPDC060344]|uniref:TetR/AcrR family transcriptional regulator n=1 Tax=Corynebacterium sp. NPDC060344 TaxID=3347101 RepID=UPI00364EAEF5